MKTLTHYRTCNLCEALCGIEIKTQGAEILSIKGDKQDTFSRGHICPKATAIQDIFEDEDRIKSPMKRNGDSWEKISWQEAYAITSSKLNAIRHQHGNDALGVYVGNPTVHNLGGMLFTPELIRALKTKNVFSATSVDQLPHLIVSYQLFGHQLQVPVPDIDRCDFFLMIGANPMASNGSIMSVPDFRGRLAELKQRGGKAVVVDPRFTETAEHADQHLFIKPGTDVLLLLAMLNTVFEEGLAKPGRLAEFTPGLEKIASDVQPYPPERVETIVGIAAHNIRQLTREFVQASAPVCYGRIGASVQEFGTLTQYFIMLLNIVTGRLDVPGGMMFTQPAANILPMSGRGSIGRHHTRVRALPGFGGELPVAALAEEILTPGEGQIRAMIVSAGNPVLTTPNGNQLERALSQLDFMVAVDYYINETNRHADIILPPVTFLERSHYDIVFNLLSVRNTAKYSKAIFKPAKNTQTDGEILLRLAELLDTQASVKKRIRRKLLRRFGPEILLDMLLRFGRYGGRFNLLKGLSISKLKKHPHGMDLGALNSILPKGLMHKDKAIHLARDFFMPDLDRVNTKFFHASPPQDNKEPLLLIGRRHIRSNNSWMHNSYRLVKGKPRCTLWLHAQDALALNVVDGETVQVVSQRGSLEIPIEVNEKIMPGVVSIPHGWGHTRKGTQWRTAEKHAGVSMNDLTDDQVVDVLSGNAVLNGIPVHIKKCQAL